MNPTSPARALAWAPAAVLLASLSAAQAPLAGAPAGLSELRDALDVTELSVQSLRLPAVPGAAFETDVELDGRLEHLVLWPHSVRAPGFEVLVQDASGGFAPAEPAPLATYRGEIVGVPGSVVAGSLSAGQFEGIVRVAPGDEWSIQPAGRYASGFAPDVHAVHAARDAAPLAAVCATDTSEAEAAPLAAPLIAGGTGPQYLIEIACDADTQFYGLNGSSVAATQLDIENVINGMAAIYEADLSTTFTITTILVRTTEPDPYSSTDAGTMLGELASHWKALQFGVQRDLAHLFTGKNIQGSTIGIAYLGGLCSNDDGYGVSQSRFTSNFNSRVGLTAHEVGHNCSASHCNGATSGCKIMCSGLGGCDGSVTSFAPVSINSISSKVSFSNCVDDLWEGPLDPPAISAILPAEIGSLVPGDEQTVSIIGTALDNAGEVRVDGKPLPGFLPNVTFQSESLITFAMPTVPKLGTVTVEVDGGTLGSDLGTIEVVPASPPALELGLGGDPEVLFSLLPVSLQVGGQPGNLVLLWASLDPSPSVFPGLFSLDIGGFTNLILLTGATIDPVGWSDVVLTPKVNLPFGTLVYFQGVEYDPISGALPLEATNVRTGEWWF